MPKIGYWVIRTYRCGAVGEKIKYWVPGEKPTRSGRKIKSDIKKQQQNEMQADRRVARLINQNFMNGDLFFGLSYSDESMIMMTRAMAKGVIADPETTPRDALIAAAERELRLFLRRVRRACEAKGMEFRYIAITSDLNPKSGEEARIHHHVVMNREALEIAQEKWTLGETGYSTLSGEPDKYGLAKYMMDQVRRRGDEKSYISSRNLVRPEPKDRIARNDAEIRVPRGAFVVYRGEFKPAAPQYVRYVMGKEAEWYEARYQDRLPGDETGQDGLEQEIRT